MKYLRLLYFLPCLFFAYLCFHLITASIILDEAKKHNLQSEKFITGIGQAMGDPWLQHSALRFYFHELLTQNAHKQIWANSTIFAHTLWNQYQFAGTIEIMMIVAHAENNQQEELYWAQRYATVLPKSKQAQEFMNHAISGHHLGKALKVDGKW